MEFETLINILSNNPEILENRNRFSGLLQDLFPCDHKENNLLLTAYDLNIVHEIQSHELDNILRHRMVSKLVNNYATDPSQAESAINQWFHFYGVGVLHKKDHTAPLPPTNLVTVPSTSSNHRRRTTFTQENHFAPLKIGTKDDNKSLTLDPFSLSHMLICGTTGSGKTAFVRSILVSMITQYPPDSLQYIIFDSKAVDYTEYNRIPGLIDCVFTKSDACIKKLTELCQVIDYRLEKIASIQAGRLSTLSQPQKAAEINMRPIICFIDDCSFLYSDPSLPDILNRILQNGHTVGIHLWLITSLIPLRGPIRNLLLYIPHKIVFRVSSLSESKALLDRSCAEKLPVPGIFFYWQHGTSLRCYAIHVSDARIAQIMSSIPSADFSTQSKNSEPPKKTQISTSPKQIDEMQLKANEIALNAGQVCISMLQRKLRIGYARAATLVDNMTLMGIVGEAKGPSNLRKVIITRNEYRKRFNPIAHSDYYQQRSDELSEKAASASQNTSSNTARSGSEGSQALVLRAFPKYTTQNHSSFMVFNNEIHLTIQVQTSKEPHTASAHFTGNIISGLKYKKPGLFFPGYIRFTFRPSANIVNNHTDITAEDLNSASALTRISFSQKDQKPVLAFLHRLSEDLHIPITKL